MAHDQWPCFNKKIFLDSVQNLALTAQSTPTKIKPPGRPTLRPGGCFSPKRETHSQSNSKKTPEFNRDLKHNPSIRQMPLHLACRATWHDHAPHKQNRTNAQDHDQSPHHFFLPTFNHFVTHRCLFDLNCHSSHRQYGCNIIFSIGQHFYHKKTTHVKRGPTKSLNPSY